MNVRDGDCWQRTAGKGPGSTQADGLGKAAWTALIEVAKAQADHQVGEDPTIRFLLLVAAAISSGRAHVADAETGKVPEDAYRWGWREHAVGTGEFAHREWRAEGKQVGWCDGENILLDPDAAYATAQGLAREQGTSLSVSQQTLWKRLAEKGVLASRDVSRGRNKVRWQIVGHRRSVIHINAAALAMETGPIGPNDPEQAKTRDYGPQTRDGLDDAPAKAARENGPKVPEYVGSGPIGPIGPEMRRNKETESDLEVESTDDGWETEL